MKPFWIVKVYRQKAQNWLPCLILKFNRKLWRKNLKACTLKCYKRSLWTIVDCEHFLVITWCWLSSFFIWNFDRKLWRKTFIILSFPEFIVIQNDFFRLCSLKLTIISFFWKSEKSVSNAQKFITVIKYLAVSTIISCFIFLIAWMIEFFGYFFRSRVNGANLHLTGRNRLRSNILNDTFFSVYFQNL